MADRPASSSVNRAVAPNRVAAARAASSETSSSAPERSADALRATVRTAGADALAPLLEDPAFDQHHAVLIPLLLERKDLPESILDRVARRTAWIASAAVQRKFVAHPRAPRRIVTRLLREFHLLDLAQFSLHPATPAEVRRLAEDLLVARIGQMPLGEKKMLARRGSARVAGALLLESSASLVAVALDNSFLTEAQVLKALSRHTLEAQAVSVISRHTKWSESAAVRLALAAHPHTPIDRVLAFLPELPRRDLQDLAVLAHLPAGVRQYFRHELARRLRVGAAPGRREASGAPAAADRAKDSKAG